MVVLSIKIKGVKETQRYIQTVMKRIPTEALRLRTELANGLATSIKITAPKNMGYLANAVTIKTFPNTSRVLIAGVPYLLPQEMGFRPHWIPLEYIKMAEMDPFARGTGNASGPFVFVSRAPKAGFIQESFLNTVKQLSVKLPNTAKRIVSK